MSLHRFHPFYSLQFVRKWLALCLLPMLRALLRFDWPSFVTALRQDAVILLVLTLISFLVWQAAGWKLNSEVLTVRQGVALHSVHQVRRSELASLVLCRPFLYRLFGASRLTLYMQRSQPGSLTLLLPKDEAARLAERLMPAEEANPVFAPVGVEKLSLMVLGFNVTLTGLMALYSARKTLEELVPFFTATAWQKLLQAEALLARVVPTGLAWLLTLGCLFYVVLLAYNFLCRARLRVARGTTVLVARFGLLRLTERRVRISAVTRCEVRLTPAARLLGRFPVYLAAGFDKGAEVPLLLVRRGDWLSLRRLMPGLVLPPRRAGSLRGRSKVAFFWFSGGGAALCLLGLVLSLFRWKAYLFFFSFGLFLFACLGLQALEGFLREGVSRSGPCLTLCYTRRFTCCEVCIFPRHASARFWQNPWNRLKGRCTFSLRLPAARYRVRSLPLSTAETLTL